MRRTLGGHTPTAEIQAALEADARMDAYYYSFDRTGVGLVDAVLSAVAVAGKGSHNTNGWTDHSSYNYYKGHPGLPDADRGADLIQLTAERSANLVLTLCDRLETAEAEIDAALRVVDPDPHPLGAGVVAMMQFQASAAAAAEAKLAAVRALAESWRYKGEFGWGPWQEGNGPDFEGQVLDDAACAILRALGGEQP